MLEESFPFKIENTNYLNTCGLGIPPKEVLEDLANTYLELAKNPCKEFEFEIDIKNYQREIMKTINQKEGDMSFTRNVTEGLVIAAQAIPFKREDEIIVTSLDHRTALNCWYLRQLHNPELDLRVKIAHIPIDATDNDIIEIIFRQVSEKTRVICVPHVDRYFGRLFPVNEICAKAKTSDIITIIDGGQAIGLVDVDLDRINCDIYVSCLHKWYLAPLTLGTISVNPRVFTKLIRTYAAGSRWYEEKIENRAFGGKELGTRNVAVEKCLGSLINFHNKWDPFIKSQRNDSKARLIDGLNSIQRVKVAPVKDLLGQYGVVTFEVKGLDTNLLISYLQSQYNITVGLTRRPTGDMVRASVFFYNTTSDIGEFFVAVEKALRTNCM